MLVNLIMVYLLFPGLNTCSFSLPLITAVLPTMGKFWWPTIPKCHVYVINATRGCEWLFAIFRAIFPTETMEKVSLFGTNSEKWRPVFKDRFRDGLLPPCLGGILEGCDAYCNDSEIWR